jgi:hypothetical protein
MLGPDVEAEAKLARVMAIRLSPRNNFLIKSPITDVFR